MSNTEMSARAQVVTRRTYARQRPDGTFESWYEICLRCKEHQRWLWERALGRPLNNEEKAELMLLFEVMYERKALLAGRTMWLGGTPTSQRREASQFNCAGLIIETVYDFVDAFWLLLQGCGVGAQMQPGSLYGFIRPLEVSFVPTTRTEAGGKEVNEEYFINDDTWVIKIGDSAEAWAKAFGKILAGKDRRATKLIIDCSEIRPAGLRLKGYGWISHGDKTLIRALTEICRIMNESSGKLLLAPQMHDIFNLLASTLSTRRAAEIVVQDYPSPGWENFVSFKKDCTDTHQWWRYQSNNTLNFYERPSLMEIHGFLSMMAQSGGSEPGIRNVEAIWKRAPWCRITNPCAEILLPNKGFCNLVTINLAHPDHYDFADLLETARLIARANYRQTCVNLRDGILQRAWHENNENLRLCGVSLNGFVQNPLGGDQLISLRRVVRQATFAMADSLQTPRPWAVTTEKPEGTAAKLLDCTEGMHYPISRYVCNNINFSQLDPLVPLLINAGYSVRPNPADSTGVLVSFPISYDGLRDDSFATESAISQLERYKLMLDHWADHNVSCTIYYTPPELGAIADWLYKNWDHYISVSFLPRADTAGYSYLPQEPISKEKYDEMMSRVKPLQIGVTGLHDVIESECPGGACPVV